MANEQGMPPPPPHPAPAMMYMHHQVPHAGPAQPMQPQMPAISEMLLREAEAWRALMSLHTVSLNATRQLVDSSGSSELELNQPQEESDQREALYYQSISHLLAQYDTLTTELIKIRGLRKAKRSVDVVAQREVLRAHSDETLALGSMIATHTSQSVTGLTSDLRKASQQLRAQLEQTRALLQALHDVRETSVPPNATIVIGLREDANTTRVFPVSEVLQQLHSTTPDSSVTEEGILGALRRLSSSSPTQSTPVSTGRTVPRRRDAA